MTAPQLVRALATLLILTTVATTARAQQSSDEFPTEEKRSMGGGVGFLFGASTVGVGLTASLLYTLKSVPSARFRLSGVGDFGSYRTKDATLSTMMAGLRVTVNPRRRWVPYGQVGVIVVGRPDTTEPRPTVGVGVEGWVKRCLKFSTEVQIIGSGEAARVFVGVAMPVRER